MKRLVALLLVAATAAAVGLVTASAHTQRTAALRVFRVTLAGENETPAGDPVATGSATIRVRPGQARVCYTLTARDLPSRAVAAHASRFYVNVHTAGFPGGAIRGQLAGQRTAVGTLFHLTFAGSGDPDG